MRSMLLVSADDETVLATALEAGADGVCLDLENSVPFAAKSHARENARAWIETAKARANRPLIHVRINDLDTEFIEADLDAMLSAGVDGLVLPNCVNGQALQHLGAKLAVKEAELGLPDGLTPIIAGVAATAASIFNMGTFAGASPRLRGLAWSAEDVVAAIGAGTSREPDGFCSAPCVLARSLTLFAARAAGVPAIDGASPRTAGRDAFQRDCEAARRDGFACKMAIGREQIEIINAIFTRAG